MRPEDLWAILWGSEDRRHQIAVMHEGRNADCWIPCAHRERFCRLLDADHALVSLVARERRYDPLSYGDAHVLWCCVTTPASSDRLRHFKPIPSMVIRKGGSSHRWAVWMCSEPVWPSSILRANERISNAVKGYRSAALPEVLMPSPFSDPWKVEFERAVSYRPGAIVKRLPDAPERDAWRRR